MTQPSKGTARHAGLLLQDPELPPVAVDLEAEAATQKWTPLKNSPLGGHRAARRRGLGGPGRETVRAGH